MRMCPVAKAPVVGNKYLNFEFTSESTILGGPSDVAYTTADFSRSSGYRKPTSLSVQHGLGILSQRRLHAVVDRPHRVGTAMNRPAYLRGNIVCAE
jgi:hypothetical protein